MFPIYLVQKDRECRAPDSIDSINWNGSYFEKQLDQFSLL